MRVFLDANLLFSVAHNPGGKTAFVIELGGAGHFLLFTSDAALVEAERNLAAKYPHSLPILEALMNNINLLAADHSAPFPDGLPIKDAVIFQAAVGCHATHFLTADLRHFGPFMNRPDAAFSIIVQTVTEFLADILKESLRP
ncbi:MAG: DNA-binding protein [Syntrophobacteraceae bacterium]